MKESSEYKDQGLELPPFDVKISSAFKESFTFPQIALNEYAVQQMGPLIDAEQQMSLNPSKDSVTSLIVLAKKVAHNLSKHYAKQWVNPD